MANQDRIWYLSNPLLNSGSPDNEIHNYLTNIQAQNSVDWLNTNYNHINDYFISDIFSKYINYYYRHNFGMRGKMCVVKDSSGVSAVYKLKLKEFDLETSSMDDTAKGDFRANLTYAVYRDGLISGSSADSAAAVSHFNNLYKYSHQTNEFKFLFEEADETDSDIINYSARYYQERQKPQADRKFKKYKLVHYFIED